MSAARKQRSLWPAPVYVAEFKDGRTCRMSFWQPVKGPFRFDAARQLACQVIADERTREQVAEKYVARTFDRDSYGNRMKTPVMINVPHAFIGMPGAAYEADASGKLVARAGIPAADIVAGYALRKDPGHEGERLDDPFFAATAAPSNVVAIRRKRSAAAPAADYAAAIKLLEMVDALFDGFDGDALDQVRAFVAARRAA